MDDVAKRREARRRKILENSEDRYNRITGIEDKPLNYINSINKSCTEIEKTTPHEEQPEQLPETSPCYMVSDTLRVPFQTNSTKDLHSTDSIVIISLAIFYNCLTLLLTKTFQLDLASSNLNKMFLPLLVYELCDFLTRSRSPSSTFTFLLSIKSNRYISRSIKHLEFITHIVRHVMVYFFVYMCSYFVSYMLGLTL